MKWIFGLIIMVFQMQSNAQGTLVNSNESAFFVGYTTSKLNSTSRFPPKRVHGGYLGFVVQRRFQFELEASRIDDTNILGIGLSTFLNLAEGIGLQPTYVFGRVDEETVNAFGGTIFLDSRNSGFKLIPRVGYARTTEGDSNFSIGADLLLGQKYPGLTAGVTLIIDGSDSTIFGINVGVLFNSKKNTDSLN